jgi:hypothetical protein
MLMNFVILSAAGTSRSEVSAESKDLYTDWLRPGRLCTCFWVAQRFSAAVNGLILNAASAAAATRISNS